jgi:serine/threonine protein kinase
MVEKHPVSNRSRESQTNLGILEVQADNNQNFPNPNHSREISVQVEIMPIAMTMNINGSVAWPGHVPKSMADHIHDEVRDTVANSRLVRKSDGIALVSQNELQIGPILGQGAFSEVHEVRVLNEQGDAHTYAMKHLKFKLMSQPDNFRLAAAELAIEAHMLASFDHPNIMKIRGWAANGVASFTLGKHDSFFLLLDKLDETLDQRINTWEKQQVMMKSQQIQSINPVIDLWRRFSNQNPHEAAALDGEIQLYQDQLYLEKLGICAEIASALAYLHNQGVIFRDLKPNNIGFLKGRVQLFDFGLSREIPSCDFSQAFEMSGKVGTLRYMAVEVACHQRYNVSADVYSWAMVCYEVLTHQKPFADWTRDMHQHLVCGRGMRPETDRLPRNIGALLQASWSQRAHERPHMLAAMHKTRMLEEQHLFSCSSLHQPTPLHENVDVAVELPHNFSLIRKCPDRTFSNDTQNTGTTMSMSGLRDYV